MFKQINYANLAGVDTLGSRVIECGVSPHKHFASLFQAAHPLLKQPDGSKVPGTNYYMWTGEVWLAGTEKALIDLFEASLGK